MKQLRKHHPVRLGVGLLLLGLASSALTGMVVGASIPWLDEYRRTFYFDSTPARYWRIVRLQGGGFACYRMWSPYREPDPPGYVNNDLEPPPSELPPRWAEPSRLARFDVDTFVAFGGWPFPAMSWEMDFMQLDSLRYALEIKQGDLRVIPLRPSWPGLLANVPVHAAIWGVLLIVPWRVRAFARRRRGRCLKCGYDSRGFASCPECGGQAAAGLAET